MADTAENPQAASEPGGHDGHDAPGNAAPDLPMTDADRDDFASAFVSSVQQGDGRPGAMRPVLVAGAVTVVAVVGALALGAAGLIGSSPAGQQAAAAESTSSATESASGPAATGSSRPPASLSPTGTPTASFAAPTRTAPSSPASAKAGAGATAATAPSVRYAAVAGDGCPTAGTSYHQSVQAHTNDWLRSANGGFTGDGCSGAYDSMPMWGSTPGWDTGAYSLYTWSLTSGTTQVTCHFGVYVPDNGDPHFVGGAPAVYHYWPRAYSDSAATSGFARFTVSQVGNLGRWVSSPSFTVTSGHVELILVNTGLDPDAQHIAAAPIALDCASG